MRERAIGVDVEGRKITRNISTPHQLALFQDFFPEGSAQYSNIIDFWDGIPKYSAASKKIQEQRDAYDQVEKGKGKHLPVLKRTFQYKVNGIKHTYNVQILPARLEEKDGTWRDYYPSEREELVEEALKKIACGQRSGIFLDDKASVIFSFYELQQELQKRGHTTSYNDLRRSLMILNKCTIDIENSNGTTEMQTAILPVFMKTSREEWLKNTKDATCYVQFHPLITRSIKALKFRQFDYLKYMNYKSQLARWFHKRIAERFTYAEVGKDYTIGASRVVQESGLVNASQAADQRKAIVRALSELVDKGTLLRFDTHNQLGARKQIQDVKYTLWPSSEFCAEVKKANIRAKIQQQKGP